MTALLLLSAALLVASGTLSASETALFSLSPKDRGRAGTRAARLIAEPQTLLVTILLGNLVVNLLFFLVAPSGFAAAGVEPSLVAPFLALVVLLIGGEIVPKAVALRAPWLVARTTALPLDLARIALSPVRSVVVRTLDTLLRALAADERADRGVTAEALAEVLDKNRESGVLRPGEADLLAEIVELGELRVREVMTPRVDCLFLDLEAGGDERERVLGEARRRRLSWIPVIRGDADSVVGSVAVRELLVRPDRAPEEAVMPVKLVPEVASALKLLQAFHEDRASEAVVVDEWGGTAGVVTLEDVFEELVGELRVEGEEKEPEVVAIGEGRYRVSGSLSVRDWNELLGDAAVPDAFETVGGYVIDELGRIPRRGDELTLGGRYRVEVESVRGRRVVDLLVERLAEPEPGEGDA